MATSLGTNAVVVRGFTVFCLVIHAYAANMGIGKHFTRQKNN